MSSYTSPDIPNTAVAFALRNHESCALKIMILTRFLFLARYDAFDIILFD